MFECYHDKLTGGQNHKSKILVGQNHKSKIWGAMALWPPGSATYERGRERERGGEGGEGGGGG